MADVVSTAREMIAGMDPVLRPGVFVFAAWPEGKALPVDRLLGMMREAEGLSVLLEAEAARALGLEALAPMRQITLQVWSSLTGHGLTAAVAGALAEAGIACNMVAALRHDHVFVPEDQAERALAVLRKLQAGALAGQM